MSDNLIPDAAEIRRRFVSRHGEDADPRDLVARMHEARQLHDDALEGLHRQAGDRALTASEQRVWDAHTRQARELEEAAAALHHQIEADRDSAVAARRAKWGSLSVTSGGSRAAWDGLDRGDSPAGWVSRAHSVLDQRDSRLSDQASQRLAEALAERDAPAAAQFIVARADPCYESGFLKLLSSPEPSRAFFSLTPDELRAFNHLEATRATLATATGTGGFLLPLSLDPNLASVANAGAANPFRQLGTVKTTASNQHRAVTSTGVTASWVAENTAISDASPTFVAVDIPLFKLAAYVTASYELFASAGDSLRETLPVLLGDARDVLEATAYVSGNGTTAPKGIITAISATAGCLVTATTRGSFTAASAVDTFALLNNLTPRTRQSPSLAALANNTTINTIRSQVIGTAGVPLVDMTSATPNIVGAPWYESSAITATTTSGNFLAVAGDFSKYFVVDHVQGPSLEFVQNVVDGSGVPLGQRGWVFWSLQGGDTVDVTKYSILKV
jgi:HK97 family phage major capsid protein